jgi:hypothetical protein
MDEGLFKKYSVRIQEQQDSKKQILTYIKEKTGVVLEAEEVALSKKEVIICTTSVKKSRLSQKNIKVLLEENGYRLKW